MKHTLTEMSRNGCCYRSENQEMKEGRGCQEGRERGSMVNVKSPAETEKPGRFLTELPLSNGDKLGGRRNSGTIHAG